MSYGLIGLVGDSPALDRAALAAAERRLLIVLALSAVAAFGSLVSVFLR